MAVKWIDLNENFFVSVIVSDSFFKDIEGSFQTSFDIGYVSNDIGYDAFKEIFSMDPYKDLITFRGVNQTFYQVENITAFIYSFYILSVLLIVTSVTTFFIFYISVYSVFCLIEENIILVCTCH